MRIYIDYLQDIIDSCKLIKDFIKNITEVCRLVSPKLIIFLRNRVKRA